MSIRVRKEASMKIIFDDMDEKELTIRTKCPKNFFLRAKETCIRGYEGKINCEKCWEKSGIELEVKG